MKYPVWFLRLLLASWMIPAGLNHFYELFPQPVGTGLGKELFLALFDSRLFDIVKAVELIAGLSLLTGFYTPLALVLLMPVSFCVFYWDVPLSPTGNYLSVGAILGELVLACNILLCCAYFESYRAMFTLRAKPRSLGEAAPPAAQPVGA